ncbi:MAG: HD domain-containing protein [Candidatus Zixiibacteriota bacterium]
MNRKRRILDNLHGLIYLTELEYKLVQTKHFQRLRHIKQLGVAELVFPGASHTRFSHSLGVLELTDKIYSMLSKHSSNYPNLERDRRVMRVAALLHDIGHYPLSHTLEAAYQKFYDYENEGSSKEDESEVNGNHKDLSKYFTKTKKVKQNEANIKDPMNHEELSKFIIEQNVDIFNILKNELDTYDIQDIKRSIIGAETVSQPYLIQLLHSDLDADNLDYCLRDSHGAGIQYGKYDINYLLDNVRLFEKDSSFVLCFKERAIHTIEHFLLARHFYYLQILYHKRRLFFEEAAKRFAIESIKIGWLPKPSQYRTIISTQQGLKFTDHFFGSLCHKAYNNQKYSFNEKSPCSSTDKMKIFAKILIEAISLPSNRIYSNKIIQELPSCLRFNHLRDYNEFKDKRDNFYNNLKEQAVGIQTMKSKFLFDEYRFEDNEILTNTFGRFYSKFSVTKTLSEYKFEKFDPKSDKPYIPTDDEFLYESRDPIRIIDKDGNISFLSEDKSSLAYMLARNKIGVYTHFFSE